MSKNYFGFIEYGPENKVDRLLVSTMAQVYDFENLVGYKWISKDGIAYHLNDMICYEYENNLPKFAKIDAIFLINTFNDPIDKINMSLK